MSVSAISGALVSHFMPSGHSGHSHGKSQQIKSDFEQLADDLESGNLTGAQQDVSALGQDIPATQQGSSNPMLKSLGNVGQDLQSGNLSSAKQDFATLQSSVQQAWALRPGSHTRVHTVPSGAGLGGATLGQDFDALKQALQLGNISSAQQAYSTLQTDMQQSLPGFMSGSSGSSSSSGTSASGVSAS